VIGYDPTSNTYVARSYDDHGVSESFEVALSGKRWRIDGETARFDGKFDSTGDRLTGLWELKGQRGGWQPWIALELARAYPLGSCVIPPTGLEVAGASPRGQHDPVSRPARVASCRVTRERSRAAERAFRLMGD
jgi:hypothetical protein